MRRIRLKIYWIKYSPKLKNLLQNLLLLIFIIFICFIFFELGVRIFWEEPGYAYPEDLHIPDDTKAFKYKPLFEGNFVSTTYGDKTIKINSKGLRDYEHEYNKSKEKIRILGLGDSVTFGAGVNLEDTYLKKLENKLFENGFNVEIINAGINSYVFNQEYDFYFDEGYNYKPNIILIGVTLSSPRIVNISRRRDLMFNNRETALNKIRNFLAKHVKSSKFIYRSFKNIIKLKGKDYNNIYFNSIYKLWFNKTWDNYKTKLLDLNKNLTKENSKLVLVLFPYTQQFTNSLNYARIPQKKISNLCLKNNIEVIDLYSCLDAPNYKEFYLVYDNSHLNEKGYLLVSDCIYENLINNKLI